MTVWQPEIQLAVGNNNVAGLVVLQSITPAGANRPFPPLDNYGLYDRGDRLIRPNATDFWRGWPFAQFFFRVLPHSHARYLQEAYCNNEYSGKVTVRLRTDDPDTFDDYNAVMRLPKLIDLSRRYRHFVDYTITFTRLEVIP